MKPWARVVCRLILVLGFVCATTYPYSLMENDAKLTSEAAVFEKPGILMWRGHRISGDNERVSVRVAAKTYSADQEILGQFFTLSRNRRHSNLTMGQLGVDLVVLLRRDSDSALEIPPILVPDVFDPDVAQVLEIVVTRDALVVNVNGTQAVSQPLVDDPFGFWDATYSLALGNEPTWLWPWTGEIRSFELTVDAATVDLLASDAVSTPGMLQLLGHTLVLVSRSAVDLLINFAVMLPVGALTALTYRRRRIARTVGLWVVVVVFVETVQTLIPERVPTISDLVLNIAGAGVGAWLLARFLPADKSGSGNGH